MSVFFHLFICTRMTQNLFFYCQHFLRDAPNLLVLSSPCTFSYPRLSCFQYLSHYKSPTRHLSSFISSDVSFLSFLDFPSASIFHRPRFFRSVICRFFHRSIHPSYICPPLPQPKRPPGVQKNKLSSWHIFATAPLQNYGVSTHFPVSAWIALSEKNTLWTCALPACFVSFERFWGGVGTWAATR